MEICEGCGSEIDPTVCHCGGPIDGSMGYHDNHMPVPMGCTCHLKDRFRVAECDFDALEKELAVQYKGE